MSYRSYCSRALLLCASLTLSTGAAALGVSQAAGSATIERIPDSYIVTLGKVSTGPLAGLSVAELAAAVAAPLGGEIDHVYEHALRGFSVRIPDAMAPLLAAHPAVLAIEPDQVMRAVDTQFDATWGIDRSDQRDLPLSGSYVYPDQAGQGVHAYVIDTGLNGDHSEFSGRVGNGRNYVAGLFGSADPGDWDDCQGHGTHVAGSVLGTRWGIAKAATIHAVRVLDCQGSGSNSDVIAGVDWVAANHIAPAVANMSLGGGNSSALDQAVVAAHNAGVTMVVAAGNDTADACSGSPNKVPEAITVGSSAANDSVSSFSNRGECLDLFAPGSNIVSASHSSNTGSATMSGTSMAAPHVAGAAALYLGANPNLSPTAVRDAMVADATAGALSGTGAGGGGLFGGGYGASPNLLLYVGNIDGSGGGTNPPVDNHPVAAFTVSCVDLSCSFDASGSSDDNGVASYAWTFGDGSQGTGVAPSHAYAAAGSYTVTLTVTDTIGQTDSSTAAVSVTAPDGGGGDPDAPCTNCTAYSGTLSNGGSAYHPGSQGFQWAGGTLKGYLRGPANADFDLYLQEYSCFFYCSWSNAASAESVSSDEDISVNASSGTYRWQVKSYSGSGDYDFWGQPQ